MTNMNNGIFWHQLSGFTRVIIHFRISNKTENKRFHDKNKTDSILFFSVISYDEYFVGVKNKKSS